jgi:hypothetical protein
MSGVDQVPGEQAAATPELDDQATRSRTVSNSDRIPGAHASA